MAKVVKKSAGPIYLAAAVWLIWALFLPMYRLIHFILVIAISAVVFVLGKKLFPNREVEIVEPVKPKTTGDPRLDELIADRDRAMSEMRRLNDSIPGKKLSLQIDHLEEVTGKIIDHVVGHPDKLPQIRKFMSYYLPTTLKLLNTYDRMQATGGEGDNITGTMERIDTMMDTVVAAFDKQLDALFADEALDIATDITVMEQLLTQEGLGDTGPFQQ